MEKNFQQSIYQSEKINFLTQEIENLKTTLGGKNSIKTQIIEHSPQNLAADLLQFHEKFSQCLSYFSTQTEEKKDQSDDLCCEILLTLQEELKVLLTKNQILLP